MEVGGPRGLEVGGKMGGTTAGGEVAKSKRMVVDWLQEKEEGREIKERGEKIMAEVRTGKELEVMGTQGERTVKQDSTLSTYMLLIISRTSLTGSSIHWA